MVKAAWGLKFFIFHEMFTTSPDDSKEENEKHDWLKVVR